MIPQTRLTDSTMFESNVVYPFEGGTSKIYKRIRIFTPEELKELIGSLRIANKYLVYIGHKYLYQHDRITFLCEPVK